MLRWDDDLDYDSIEDSIFDAQVEPKYGYCIRCISTPKPYPGAPDLCGICMLECNASIVRMHVESHGGWKENMAEVSLEFTVSADLKAATETVARIHGVQHVEQVFPDKADEDELYRLFVVTIDDADKDRTLRQIAGLPIVRFAQIVSPRSTK